MSEKGEVQKLDKEQRQRIIAHKMIVTHFRESKSDKKDQLLHMHLQIAICTSLAHIHYQGAIS